jgi:hypothetical protein
MQIEAPIFLFPLVSKKGLIAAAALVVIAAAVATAAAVGAF